MDGSLSFKKNTFESLSDYFDANKSRINAIDEVFSQFNVPNIKSQKLKWVNIDTNTKTKLKIKEINGKKYKFKWPKIPQQGASNDDGQDWRLPLTLKFFNSLNEPHKSFFLTSALYTPEKNLIAPTFETTAQAAAKSGPFDKQSKHKQDASDDILSNMVADADYKQMDREKKSRKKKKSSKKKRDKQKAKKQEAEELEIPKGGDSPNSGHSNSPSVKLPQARTSSVLDMAATLEEIPKPSEPPPPVDDGENEDEDDKKMQQQLMAEAFKKFQEKKRKQKEQEQQAAMPSAPSAPPGIVYCVFFVFPFSCIIWMFYMIRIGRGG